MAKRPELEFPENGSGDPTVDVWQSDGTFDSHKAETIFEETKNWPPEQRAAMLRSLRAAETRATVRTKYRHPAEMAAAVTPGSVRAWRTVSTASSAPLAIRAITAMARVWASRAGLCRRASVASSIRSASAQTGWPLRRITRWSVSVAV